MCVDDQRIKFYSRWNTTERKRQTRHQDQGEQSRWLDKVWTKITRGCGGGGVWRRNSAEGNEWKNTRNRAELMKEMQCRCEGKRWKQGKKTPTTKHTHKKRESTIQFLLVFPLLIHEIPMSQFPNSIRMRWLLAWSYILVQCKQMLMFMFSNALGSEQGVILDRASECFFPVGWTNKSRNNRPATNIVFVRLVLFSFLLGLCQRAVDSTLQSYWWLY